MKAIRGFSGSKYIHETSPREKQLNNPHILSWIARGISWGTGFIRSMKQHIPKRAPSNRYHPARVRLGSLASNIRKPSTSNYTA